jgi:hypothetical protein
VTARSLVSPIVWSGFSAAYLAVFFASSTVPTRLLWYLPLDHAFIFTIRPEGLGMDFYGRLLLSFGAGLVGAVAAGAIESRLSETRRRGALRVLLVWTIGLLLFTSGLYVNLLTAREPKPLPLPADYVPR